MLQDLAVLFTTLSSENSLKSVVIQHLMQCCLQQIRFLAVSIQARGFTTLQSSVLITVSLSSVVYNIDSVVLLH